MAASTDHAVLGEPQPAHRLVVRARLNSRASVGRVLAVASAVACIAGVAVWVGTTGRAEERGAATSELLATAHFGAAKAQLQAQADKVTKQLYAAEDQDAKTGFKVAKDQVLVQELEHKAEKISAQLKGQSVVKPAREMMLARSNALASLAPKPSAQAATHEQVISLSEMGQIIKAVKDAEGTNGYPSLPSLLFWPAPLASRGRQHALVRILPVQCVIFSLVSPVSPNTRGLNSAERDIASTVQGAVLGVR